jgi:putative peptide zinc metalloprotease protein
MQELKTLQGLQGRIVVDTSEGKPVYLIAVGKLPTYIRLSAISYYLLQQRSEGVTFDCLAQNLTGRGKQVSPAEVESAYNQVIEKIAEIERNPKLHRSGFLWKRTLFPKQIVGPIASCLSVAFSKPIAYSLLALIAASVAIAPQHDLGLSLEPIDLFWAYFLFIGSLIAHEFGHASACARYGAEPSDIGFTLYLIWPAFYSDVSAAWKLKRWERVVVDIGGVFFQLVCAAIYVIIYTITSWIPLKISLVMIAASCLFTLNPVFKFDGYWVVADTLGVTNLSQQPIRIFQHYLDRMRQRPVKPLPWPPLIISILAIYTVLSFGMWGYFLWLIIPVFSKAIIGYPSLTNELIIQLSIWPPSISLDLIKSFLGSTFIISILGFMLWRFLQQIKVCKVWIQKIKMYGRC